MPNLVTPSAGARHLSHLHSVELSATLLNRKQCVYVSTGTITACWRDTGPRLSRADFAVRSTPISWNWRAPSALSSGLPLGACMLKDCLSSCVHASCWSRKVQSKQVTSTSKASGVWPTTSHSSLSGWAHGQTKQMHLRETSQPRAGALRRAGYDARALTGGAAGSAAESGTACPRLRALQPRVADPLKSGDITEPKRRGEVKEKKVKEEGTTKVRHVFSKHC